MKRTFDIIFSTAGLVLLLPLFAAIGTLILVFDGRPILFRQNRIGLRGKPFGMWKFRTMVRDAEKLGKQLTVGRDPRITRMGSWLRKSKLDELPQLWNVLVGEMSFVGPRPEVECYVRRYNEDQRRVLDFVPGITDAASIRFRNESDILATTMTPEQTYVEVIIPEKIRLNLEYLQRANLFSDFAVICQTLMRICRR